MLTRDSKIFVAGHNGMVGSAIVRRLQERGYDRILTRSRQSLDLCNQQAVVDFFKAECPDYVVIAAAKVGGIFANNEYPGEFIYQNLMIECNVIHQAYLHDVKGLLFLGSSCIYPKLAEQPMRESELLTGALEPTNEPYAIAKIAGIKMCESYNRQYHTDYRSIMPTNLYGPGDNYHGENSHVIPALIKKFHEAKQRDSDFVEIWGTGAAKREFLHADDLAEAALMVMQADKETVDAATSPMQSHINVGTGEDVSIAELAELVKKVTGFGGALKFDTSKPDGAPRKLLQVDKLKSFGWLPTYELEEGLRHAYQCFLQEME